MVDAKTGKTLEEAIKSRIKEVKIKIESKLKLTSFAANGVDIVKEALKKAEEAGKENILIKYLGAGSYNVTVNGKDYKEAEKILEKASEKALEYIRKNDGDGELVRVKA